MRHFVSYFNDSVKKHWDLPAVTNFGKETYTYAQLAEGIEKYHILFEKAGIKKGDNVALYARNSAEWCIAYYATLTYDAVTVPFLPDFTPASVVELSAFSECKMIIVDDIAYDGLKSSEELINNLEKIKGFVGILNLKDIKVLRDSSKILTEVCENIDAEMVKRHPNGLTPDSIN